MRLGVLLGPRGGATAHTRAPLGPIIFCPCARTARLAADASAACRTPSRDACSKSTETATRCRSFCTTPTTPSCASSRMTSYALACRPWRTGSGGVCSHARRRRTACLTSASCTRSSKSRSCWPLAASLNALALSCDAKTSVQRTSSACGATSGGNKRHTTKARYP